MKEQKLKGNIKFEARKIKFIFISLTSVFILKLGKFAKEKKNSGKIFFCFSEISKFYRGVCPKKLISKCSNLYF